jgi:hypothetical protein
MNQINGDASCRRTFESKFVRKRVQIIGYLCMNPEHKSIRAANRKYAVLLLVTQRSWRGADEEWHSKTDWHRAVVRNGALFFGRLVSGWSILNLLRE